MTHTTDLPANGEPHTRADTPTHVRIRAMLQAPRHDGISWNCELRAIDPARRGLLAAILAAGLVARIEARTGHPLRAEDLVGEHVLDLAVTVDPAGELIGQIVDLDIVHLHDEVLRTATATARDEAIRARLTAEGNWSAQRALARIDRLRRVALIEPRDNGSPEGSLRLADWQARGMLTLLGYPIDFDGPRVLGDLNRAIDSVEGQFEWGTLDALIVVLDAHCNLAALQDEALLRRLCTLPVPIVVAQPDRPILLAEFAHVALASAEELIVYLEAILRRELRSSDYARLAVIAEAFPPDASAMRQGPLFEE